MADIESYIFGAGTPNLDYQALAQRRAIAQALAGRKRDFPKTIGEGMTALGEALGETIAAKRAERMAAGQQAAERSLISGAPEGPAYTGALPGAAPALGAPRADLQIEPQLAPGFYAGGDDEALANRRAAAIGGIETGGQANPYQALGPVTKTGDRAYGRYQVMGANIPAWSKAALGAELTPEQFLASKEAQDDIFRNQFGGYVDKHGEQGAARAWLGGEGSIDKPGRADQLGTTVGAYGDRYMASLGGGATPTRMAAVNLPGSTISDAAPVAAAPAASPNPATVVADIRPKPAPTSTPSLEPIPPASEQEMKPPGAEPVRPGIIGPTKPMTYWGNIKDNPNVSPGMQNYAKTQYERAKDHRDDIQKRQDEDFTHGRGVWQKKSDAWDEFVRTKPDRAIEQLTKRLAIETSQAGIEKTRLELAKAITLRDGGVWNAEVEKAHADAITARRAAVKPETHSLRETVYERLPDPTTGKLGPLTVAPGAPPPKEPELTGPQAKAVEFGKRTMTDLQDLETKFNNGKALTSWTEHALYNTPGVNLAAGATVSDSYKNALDAFGNWGAAFMSHVSGAAITPSEAMRQLPAFMPVPGDSDARLAEKARRRRDMSEGITSGAGPGRAMVEQFQDELFNKEAAKPPVPVKGPDDIKKYPSGQRLLLPDGTPGQVPKRKLY